VDQFGQKKLEDIIVEYTDEKETASTIWKLSNDLVKAPYFGDVPTSKVALMKFVNEDVATVMMTQAFHSTELQVGLHARKILAALDMIDWEEYGATVKTDIRMTTIVAAHVQKSLQTWIPKGTGKEFHHVMESLGSYLESCRWGLLTKVINAHFPKKEKATILVMVETISQFSTATKSKKAKTSKPREAQPVEAINKAQDQAYGVI
jgi:endonuclease III